MAFKLVEKKLEENENIFLSGKEFFKKIRSEEDSSSPIKYDMDIFILCLILGLMCEQKKTLKDYKFYQSFSPKYIDSHLQTKPIITALLLSRTLKYKNVDKNEKEKVKKVLQEVLDTNDPIDLKTDYIDLMHEYYLGGHCLLLEKFNYKSPDEISVFFDKYNKLITN